MADVSPLAYGLPLDLQFCWMCRGYVISVGLWCLAVFWPCVFVQFVFSICHVSWMRVFQVLCFVVGWFRTVFSPSCSLSLLDICALDRQVCTLAVSKRLFWAFCFPFWKRPFWCRFCFAVFALKTTVLAPFPFWPFPFWNGTVLKTTVLVSVSAPFWSYRFGTVLVPFWHCFEFISAELLVSFSYAAAFF